jgi:hypothetical protein
MAGLDPAIHAFTNIRTWALFYQPPMSQNKKVFLLVDSTDRCTLFFLMCIMTGVQNGFTRSSWFIFR